VIQHFQACMPYGLSSRSTFREAGEFTVRACCSGTFNAYTHKAHKLTPAMAAGITDKLWSVEDIVALVEAVEPKPGKRGPYKKRVAA
jgi:hypothetical protein